jgi:predicted secreted protein
MSSIILTAEDNGRVVITAPGQEVAVRLAENPATGYVWALDSLDEEVVTVQAESFEPAGDASFGGGGLHTWQLLVKQGGQSLVGFKLWREWEGEQGVIERYQVTIQVFT